MKTGESLENGEAEPAGAMEDIFSGAEMRGRSWAAALAPLWLAGVLAFWCRGAGAALRFRWRLRFAMELEEGVYESDAIDSPCVFGLFRPAVYLIPGLSETEKAFILCHERAHIRHGDHLWKILAYGIMGLHWFNLPLWGVCRIFLNELEKSCDEAVVSSMGAERKEEYCEVLLALATERRRFAFAPPAFGEERGKNDMKDRVKQILRYQRPRKGLQGAILAVSVGLSLCLLSGGARGAGISGTDLTETETGKRPDFAEQLYELKNPYVGDAPGDGALINILKPYLPASGISMELETKQQPYSLILKLEGDSEEPIRKALEHGNSSLDQAAGLLLALISNLDQVVWEYPDTEDGDEIRIRLYMDTSWASETWEIDDIKEYGSSPERLRELLELIGWQETASAGESEIAPAPEAQEKQGQEGVTAPAPEEQEKLGQESVIAYAPEHLETEVRDDRTEKKESAENYEDTALIGGVDGPTSIWIAGKEDGLADSWIGGAESGDGEEDQEGIAASGSSRTAIDFLIDFFTVRQAEADALAERLKQESRELEAQIRRQLENQPQSGNGDGKSEGFVAEYVSDTLEALLGGETFSLLNENAKDTLSRNRWLLLPYQFSELWEEDVKLDSCGLELIYLEEEKARYEYTALIKSDGPAGQECEISGYIRLKPDGAEEWVIDEVTVNILTEGLQTQALQEWSRKLTEDDGYGE